ncbi:MAG: ABC transporter ATP-binding protein [Oscillospiraceae bacterium]
MLDINNLSCGYNNKNIINGLSFSIKENENICILGANGSGKTTILKAISGILPISSGDIFINGVNIRTLKRKDISRKMALLSQLTTQIFSYTVFDTVMLGRYVHNKNSIFQKKDDVDKRMVLDCLDKTGVLNLKDTLITELSGGQLQRVFLARVFAQDPDIILLDEPTNHLDLKYQVELINNLRQWSEQKNKCVVGVLHDVNLALSFADKILLLDKGEIISYENKQNFDLSLINKIYDMDVKKHMINSLKIWSVDKYENIQK